MKMVQRLLVLFIVALTFLQCKDKTLQHPELDKLIDEVMTIHDDVMPKTATIHRLKKKLKKNTREEDKESIAAVVEQLDLADEGMMQWMENWKKPKGKTFDEAKAYLLSEKDKIVKVKKDILSSIAVAEELIPKTQ